MGKQVNNQYAPDRVSPPGATLQEILDAQGLSQLDFAKRIGRTTKNVNQIVKGKAPILPEVAILFETVLGVPADFWLAREQRYQESLARGEADAELASETDWPSRFPIAEMIRRGWVRRVTGGVAQLREMLRYFAISNPSRFDQVCDAAGVAYRKSQAFEADEFALVAWIRHGEIEGHQIECAPYSEARFRAALEEVRHFSASVEGEFSEKLRDICAPAGVAVVVTEELPKCRVSGATKWLSSTKALLQVSLRYKRDDRFWFSFFHEAGHIVLHARKDVFIDNDSRARADLELEADRFASDLLIPPADYRGFVKKGKFDDDSIRRFARSLGLAPGIVVGRLQYVKVIPWSWGNSLKRELEWTDS